MSYTVAEVHLSAERLMAETTMCIVRVPEIGYTLCINSLFGISTVSTVQQEHLHLSIYDTARRIHL